MIEVDGHWAIEALTACKLRSICMVIMKIFCNVEREACQPCRRFRVRIVYRNSLPVGT